jgi:hypothetical protein
MRPLREDSRPSGKRQSATLESRSGSKRAIRPPPNKNRSSGRPNAKLPRSAQNQAAAGIATNRHRNIRPSDIRQQSQQKKRIHRPVKSLHSPNSSPKRDLSLAVIPAAAKLPRRPPHTPSLDAPRRNPSPSHSPLASASRPYPEKPPAPDRSQPSGPAPDTRKT